MNTNKKVNRLAMGAIIAAMYIVLTLVSASIGLSSGPIQFRLSEALCILPAFTPAAIPGLVIGCFLSNLIAGGILIDMILGSIATLIGAIGTYVFRKNRWLECLCPILSNAIIIPFILIYEYGMKTNYFLLFGTVGLGEVVCVGILGSLLYSLIKKSNLDKQFK